MPTSINSSGVTFPDSTTQTTAMVGNSVNASFLDVVGNGNAGQVLSSDGDGSFSWSDPGAYQIATANFTSEDEEIIIDYTGLATKIDDAVPPQVSLYRKSSDATASQADSYWYNDKYKENCVQDVTSYPSAQVFNRYFPDTTDYTSYQMALQGNLGGGIRNTPQVQLNQSAVGMSTTPTAGFNTNTSSGSLITSPEAFDFSPCGTIIFVSESTGGQTARFYLQKPWDLSSVYYSHSEGGSLTNTAGNGTTAARDVNWVEYKSSNGTITNYMLAVSSHWDSIVTIGIDDWGATGYGNWSVVGQSTITRMHDNESTPLNVRVKNEYSSTKLTRYTRSWLFLGGQTNDAIRQYAINPVTPTAGNVAHAIPDGRRLYHGGQTTAYGFFEISSDGKRCWVSHDTNEIIYEYVCSTAWDIGTASYVGSISLGTSYGQTIRGIRVSPNNTDMYVLFQSGDWIRQYSYASASSSYTTAIMDYGDQTGTSFPYELDIDTMRGHSPSDKGERDNATQYFAYSGDDGTSWYIPNPQSYGTYSTNQKRKIVRNNGGTWQYNSNSSGNAQYRSHPSVAGMSYNDAISVSGAVNNPRGVAVHPNGYDILVCSETNDDLAVYTMSTQWDLSTATFQYHMGMHYSSIRSVAISHCGSYMAFAEANNSQVHKFHMPDHTFASAYHVQSWGTGGTSPRGVAISPGGEHVVWVDSSDELIRDNGSRVMDGWINDTYYGLAFSPCGHKFFAVNSTRDSIYMYDLKEAFKLSSAYYSGAANISGYETSPWGLAISRCGRYLYTCGESGDDINRYNLQVEFTRSTSETWTNASINSENYALYQAMNVADNRFTWSDAESMNAYQRAYDATKPTTSTASALLSQTWENSKVDCTSNAKIALIIKLQNNSYYSEFYGIRTKFKGGSTSWVKVDPKYVWSDLANDVIHIGVNDSGDYTVRLT